MNRYDTVVRHGKSRIQHGHLNNRIYVMHLAPEDIPDIIRYADELAGKEGYSKIFVKVPESAAEIFADNGYITEATVPSFFQGKEPAVFMGKYPDPERRVIRDQTRLTDVLSSAGDHAGECASHSLPEGFSLMCANPDDAEEIAALFSTVFRTYPFPILDPEYLKKTMEEHIRYYLIRKDSVLAAVASCEVDGENKNAEVTDFATAALFRGRGLAAVLLRTMETELRNEGILLAFTIARALSHPMNNTFAGAGYRFGGMLPNNTNICGSLECMNVWYKTL
ncbi:putative beta-lysine N-acetyltransferase [Methanoregula sp.]|uniref:putative beta-lysine N-acetyltransferase n=1 Tax=Methanoregula sp. TaxID=2052170 RepID=UPI000CA92535|nr:putative beta-lysine N-acetyltransferase [Methanoregula sp.]PKG33933.1 MAG: putative beta-lysine N-acetyltransferase [Methanoregula sp.]